MAEALDGQQWAMEYPELSLADVIGQMHDNALHDEAAEPRGAAARYRKPLVPLLQALRDADRGWEITAILRRTIGAGDIPAYKAQQNFGTRYHGAHKSADRVGEVFAGSLPQEWQQRRMPCTICTCPRQGRSSPRSATRA
ncbi:hypothetical protein [Streptomyces sp. NPDC001536]|uniref:hypothetical protein n=1 Tax=Streptomyces sp. NPDC001536 TaxID=3364583 RepID=UPI00367A0252